MLACRLDYRSAYRVVGHAVRNAADRGLRGVDLDAAALDAAAIAVLDRPLGLDGGELSRALDPQEIVRTRTARGGAAPAEVARMADACIADAGELSGKTRTRREHFHAAEQALIAAAQHRMPRSNSR
jgi:argininosuccinate lyase